MSNSSETNDVDSNNINTKQVIKVIGVIVLGVVVFYVANFHYGLSIENGDWETFGDYFGGILNPVIAAFAFYLIAKTYELQKWELKETRVLLKVSTDAQEKQIKLAALTSLLNSILMRIGILNSEKFSLLQGVPLELKNPDRSSALPSNQIVEILKKAVMAHSAWLSENSGTPEGKRFVQIEKEIKELNQKAAELEVKIEYFYN